MKRIFLPIILFLIAFSSCVCVSKDGLSFSGFENEGKGPMTSKDYDQLHFCGVEINNGLKAKIYKSPNEKVRVSAPSDIIDCIEVKQLEGRNILLKVKSNSNISTKKIKVEIYTTDLCKIASSSGSHVEVVDEFLSPSLSLSSNSGSYLKGKFKSKKLSASSSSGSSQDIDIQSIESTFTSSSGSSMEIRGYTELAKANTSSGSEIDAKELNSKEVHLTASSGGELKISATSQANANASSGGDIQIYRKGTTFTVNKTETSGGSVEIK